MGGVDGKNAFHAESIPDAIKNPSALFSTEGLDWLTTLLVSAINQQRALVSQRVLVRRLS